MPRLLGDEVQDHQPKVAVGEEPAEPGPAAATFVAVMPPVPVALAMLAACEAAAVAMIVAGMPVV
ncbi:MAG: hypothetical protein WDN25_15580 [Acetobacteraceae bacterium]